MEVSFLGIKRSEDVNQLFAGKIDQSDDSLGPGVHNHITVIDEVTDVAILRSRVYKDRCHGGVAILGSLLFSAGIEEGQAPSFERTSARGGAARSRSDMEVIGSG